MGLFLWLSAQAVVAPGKMIFYVQLVRGNDNPNPPAEGGKAIGPKQANEFRRVFKWKQFWEMSCTQAQVNPGEKVKIKLSPEREVEIDLTVPGKRSVTAFSKGQAVSKMTDRTDARMTLIGSERDAQSAWFIAVRLDKPAYD